MIHYYTKEFFAPHSPKHDFLQPLPLPSFQYTPQDISLPPLLATSFSAPMEDSTPPRPIKTHLPHLHVM